jgi:hypothetical protein
MTLPSDQKAYLPQAAHWFVTRPVLVSVLDLDNIALEVEPQIAPYSEQPAILMLYLSIRCQFGCPSSLRVTWASSERSDDQTLRTGLDARIVSRVRNRAALVGRGGLEPPTSRLSGVRSNHLSYRPQRARAALLQAASLGGAYRDRTDDPLLAKQMLSQLS